MNLGDRPPGPPGPPGSGELHVVQRSAEEFSRISATPPFGRLFHTSEAKCNSDEIVVGGGFTTGENENSQRPPMVIRSEFATNNGWTIIAESPSEDNSAGVKAIAECAKIS